MRAARVTLFLLFIMGCAPDAPDARRPEGSPAPPPSAGPTSASPFDAGSVGIELRHVLGGFDLPVLVTHAGDGSGRLFVVEQGGRVVIVERGRAVDQPFLDITDLTDASGEQGLLGLAFHPDYATNGRLFVNYTDLNGDTVVAEYRVGGDDPDVVDEASSRTMLRVDQPFSNHNGGNMVFGPDGYLYIGLGDGGSAGDPMGNGQRLDTLLGKMLRIDVDGDEPYEVPSGNPFVDGSGARPEIWALGLRNPWRYSFDPPTGTLWIADVGQGDLEEINRLDVRADAGANLGWNILEGDACYEPPSGCDRSGTLLPVATYGRTDGCSVTGGHVYRGSQFPALVGGYFFGDYCSGKIWVLDAVGASPQQPVELLNTDRSISSFGADERDELYVADHAAGEIFQIVAE